MYAVRKLRSMSPKNTKSFASSKLVSLRWSGYRQGGVSRTQHQCHVRKSRARVLRCSSQLPLRRRTRWDSLGHWLEPHVKGHEDCAVHHDEEDQEVPVLAPPRVRHQDGKAFLEDLHLSDLFEPLLHSTQHGGVVGSSAPPSKHPARLSTRASAGILTSRTYGLVLAPAGLDFHQLRPRQLHQALPPHRPAHAFRVLRSTVRPFACE